MTGSDSRVGIAGGMGRGLVAGLAAGTIWWLVELAVNWAFGGVIPMRQALTVLALVLAVLPLIAVVLDRIVGFVVRHGATRLAVELAAALVAALVWGKPLSTASFDDPRPLRAVAPASSPDVFLISMDTTRADHM